MSDERELASGVVGVDLKPGETYVQRVPFRAVRYSWTLQLADFWSISGWAFTKRGARRAARRSMDQFIGCPAETRGDR